MSSSVVLCAELLPVWPRTAVVTMKAPGWLTRLATLDQVLLRSQQGLIPLVSTLGLDLGLQWGLRAWPTSESFPVGNVRSSRDKLRNSLGEKRVVEGQEDRRQGQRDGERRTDSQENRFPELGVLGCW